MKLLRTQKYSIHCDVTQRKVANPYTGHFLLTHDLNNELFFTDLCHLRPINFYKNI